DQRFVARGGKRRGLQRDLRFPVAVEIPDDVRRPPDPHVHVPAEILSPQERAVVAVRFDLVRFGTEGGRARIEAGGRLLDDVVELSVAIEIRETDLLKRRVLVPELDRNVRAYRLIGGQLDPAKDVAFLRRPIARE